MLNWETNHSSFYINKANSEGYWHALPRGNKMLRRLKRRRQKCLLTAALAGSFIGAFLGFIPGNAPAQEKYDVTISGRLFSLPDSSTIPGRIDVSNSSGLIKSVEADSTGYFSIDLQTLAEKGSNSVPTNFKLSQNYPNPFSGNTNIDVTTDKELIVQVYNLTGQVVKEYQVNPGETKVNITFGPEYASGHIFFFVKDKTGHVIGMKKGLKIGDTTLELYAGITAAVAKTYSSSQNDLGLYDLELRAQSPDHFNESSSLTNVKEPRQENFYLTPHPTANASIDDTTLMDHEKLDLLIETYGLGSAQVQAALINSSNPNYNSSILQENIELPYQTNVQVRADDLHSGNYRLNLTVHQNDMDFNFPQEQGTITIDRLKDITFHTAYPDSTAIEGLFVRIYQDNKVIQNLKTDQNGNAAFRLDPGEYQVQIFGGRIVATNQNISVTVNAIQYFILDEIISGAPANKYSTDEDAPIEISNLYSNVSEWGVAGIDTALVKPNKTALQENEKLVLTPKEDVNGVIPVTLYGKARHSTVKTDQSNLDIKPVTDISIIVTEGVTGEPLNGVAIYDARGKIVAYTGADGSAKAQVGTNNKIIIGDTSIVIPGQQAYTPPKDGSDVDLGTRAVLMKDYPLKYLIKFQNYAITDENDPNAYAYVTGIDSSIVDPSGVVKLKYVNPRADKMEELVNQVNNINTHLAMFNKKYQLPLPNAENILYRPVGTRQEEIALRDSLKNDPDTALFWLLSSTNMWPGSYTNADPTGSTDKYTATKGTIITPNWIGAEEMFGEAMIAILDMQGETSDEAWINTLFDGITNNTSFPVNIKYNNRDVPAEVLIGNAKQSQEPGTKLVRDQIIYWSKDFSENK